MIQVRYHRYERADLSILRRRRSREDRQHSRTGKVAGTTDTIHHTSTGYVRRVDITEDISLQSRIDSDQA